MQTFLPYPDFARSAAVLDRQRLGKQRVEAKQILLALRDSSYGWQSHPAVKMWRGYDNTLAWYGETICNEWIKRGYKDSCKEFFTLRLIGKMRVLSPPWLTEEFCRSHQSNLLRKLPAHYGPLFPGVPPDLPYVWPVK